MPTTEPTQESEPKLSTAGYGDAYASFIAQFSSTQFKLCAATARQILEKSKSYSGKVTRLNKKYLSAQEVDENGGIAQFNPDDDGKLTTGKHSGRHTLFFSSNRGNRFVPPGSDQTQTTAFPFADFIMLTFPNGGISSATHRGRFLAQLAGALAHETAHAFHRVTKVDVPGLTRKQRADAFIDEEIATREEEKTILKEVLLAKTGSKKALEVIEQGTKGKEEETQSEGLRKEIQNRVDTMILARAEVERDKVSGTPLTYLGTFVMEDLIRESILLDQLLPPTIKKNKALVKRLAFDQSLDTILQTDHPELHTSDPKTGLKTVFLPTTLAELFLCRRVLEENWSESTDDREETLQRHQKFAFPADIQYTELP